MTCMACGGCNDLIVFNSKEHDGEIRYCEGCDLPDEDEDKECETCRFCDEPNTGCWIEGQEDAVCEKCSKVWEYDDATDDYYKINKTMMTRIAELEKENEALKKKNEEDEGECHCNLANLKPKKCSTLNCIGGQGFEIKDKLFCSPSCGNKYWDLKKGDNDYWSNVEDDACPFCEVGPRVCDCDKCKITGCYECVSGYDGDINLCDECGVHAED